ncbi:MmgE/PrpD family protein [Hoeflea sp. TYP-13]|uniref:MmgE/PrpD family protein n=1 Tax=Hoeflea sp. TYP-13 TaxID=3230023 RepID=UPI0034C60314
MALSFTQFMTRTDYADVPQNVRRIMRRSLLDTIGVAIVGTTTEISRIVRHYATEFWGAAEGKPGARMICDGRRVSPAGAAFAGAFTIDSIDAHDGYSAVKGHAGSAVMPGMLAIFEERRDSGRPLTAQDLMVGMALGYEIGYRSGLAQHGTLRDYHSSGAWNAVGVAAAGARLLGLNEQGIRHAAGIAEYHGPRSQMMRCIEFPTMLRDGVGWGAPTGVSAAYMAAMGFTGAPALTIEADNARDWWSGLGERWETEETHYKLYPVCRWAHPALDAIKQLMTDNHLSYKDIARIRIRTFHNAVRLAGADPQNLDEMTYGMIYPAAVMAVRGQIGRCELREDVLTDPEIRRLARATELVETEQYTAISVRKRWADVSLLLKNGRELASDPKTPRGDPDDPLTDAEISLKFHAFTEGLIYPERARAIEEACGMFDQLNSSELNELFDLIFTATSAALPDAAL